MKTAVELFEELNAHIGTMQAKAFINVLAIRILTRH